MDTRGKKGGFCLLVIAAIERALFFESSFGVSNEIN